MAFDLKRLVESFFDPLLAAIDDFGDTEMLLAELGWEVVLNETQTEALREIMGLRAHAETLAGVLSILRKEELSINDVAELQKALQSINESIRSLRNISAQDLAKLPAPLNEKQAWEKLAEQELPAYLLLTWLWHHVTPVYEVLHFAGVISEFRDAPHLPIRRSFDWQALGLVLSNPGQAIAEYYDWGGNFSHADFVSNAARLLQALGVRGRLEMLRRSLGDQLLHGTPPLDALEFVVDTPALTEFLGDDVAAEFVLAPASQGLNTPPNGIAVSVATTAGIETESDFPSRLHTRFSASAAGSAGLILDNGGLTPAAGADNLQVSAGLSWKADGAPYLLVGNSEGTRLELHKLEIGAEFSHKLGVTDASLLLALGDAQEPGMRLIIAPGDADSFIAHILGKNELAIDLGAAVRWNSRSGLEIEDGAGLEFTKAIGKSFGPIYVDSVSVAAFGGLQGLEASGTVSGSVNIGIMEVATDQIGLGSIITPQDANLPASPFGPISLTHGLKPPAGLGLALDAAGVISGGGYLSIDQQNGRYAGAAQVRFVNLGLGAIAIVETQLPSRPDAWSMFLSLFGESFKNENEAKKAMPNPRVEVGFGLYLKGLGALLGINRTIDPVAFESRLRSVGLDSILFPEDPVANAPAILADIATIFPAADGQYLFGAMFKLAWGLDQAEADLGVIVELPDPVRVALMGQVSVTMPLPSLPVIDLHMDAGGIADLTAGTISLDAVLRDSSIAKIIHLSGAMALRGEFQGKPSLSISIGGFHPRFVAPPGFPKLDRVRAQIPVGNVADVSLSGYIAVTPGSLQAGGRIDVYASISEFSIEGYVGIDTLIQSSPFRFDTSTEFGVSVMMGQTTLLGVDVEARILGPSPLKIIGDAQFEILEFKKSIELNISTQGSVVESNTQENVADLVAEALGAPEALSLRSDPAGSGAVRTVEDAAGFAPNVTLNLAQSIAPLNTRIEKFGDADIEGPNLFDIDRVFLNDRRFAISNADHVEDWFTRERYFAMSNEEKLKAPAFEEMPAGVSVSAEASVEGAEATIKTGFEEIYVDRALETKRGTAQRRTRQTPKIVEDAYTGRLAIEKAARTNARARQKNVGSQVTVT